MRRRTSRRGSDTSTLKKLLLSVMIIGAVGTTVGSGTFASFNATGTNVASTFQTGSVILSNYKPMGTVCVSTGGTEAGGTFASNANNCDVLFDGINNGAHSSKRPGEYASIDLNLKNVGNLAGTLSVQSAADCTMLSDPLDQPIAGTGDSCDILQLAIEDSTTCYWGDNMGTVGTAPYITSAPLTYPVVITTGVNDKFNLTVDGVVHADVTLTAGSYASAAALAAEVTSKISAWATASASGSSIRITSNTSTPSANVTMNIPSTASHSAVYSLGYIDGSQAAGPGKCATSTGDDQHSLRDFFTTTTVTPVSLGTIASGGTERSFKITVGVPSIVTDQMQGRTAGFELTWILTA